MHIRGGNDHDMGGIGNGGRERGGGLLNGEHRQEQIHSALKIAEGARVALPCTTPMTESESHRILVVDDEPDITALVAYHLAKAGYRVITAVNGRDALRTARQERPDLVVLDLIDRKSTRLNSSHLVISYAVFCLKKKKHTPPTVTPVERA